MIRTIKRMAIRLKLRKLQRRDYQGVELLSHLIGMIDTSLIRNYTPGMLLNTTLTTKHGDALTMSTQSLTATAAIGWDTHLPITFNKEREAVPFILEEWLDCLPGEEEMFKRIDMVVKHATAYAVALQGYVGNKETYYRRKCSTLTEDLLDVLLMIVGFQLNGE